MDEMFCYIFGELQNNRTELAKIQKALRHQKKINSRLAFLTLMAIGYSIAASISSVEIKKTSDEKKE